MKRISWQIQIPDGTAVTVKNSIDSILNHFNMNTRNLVSFGSDGASVMVGRHNGVATKLKGENPFLVNVHCIAHCLALSTSQEANSVQLIKDFADILSSLYYHFEKSAVRSNKLHEVQEVLQEPVLSVKEVHSVRWIALFNALTTIYRCWASIATTLTHDALVHGKDNSKAKGILKKCF